MPHPTKRRFLVRTTQEPSEIYRENRCDTDLPKLAWLMLKRGLQYGGRGETLARVGTMGRAQQIEVGSCQTVMVVVSAV